MAATAQQGIVVMRAWDREQGGLQEETALSFTSLDELLDLCLHAITPTTAQRIILCGVDERGRPHTVTLRLISIARSEEV